MTRVLSYEVLPGENLPSGLPLLTLPVLSPIWEGPALHLEYRDGEVETLLGWRGADPGAPCEVKVFWTRHEPQGPAVCLAIGGNGGLKVLGDPEAGTSSRGLPFPWPWPRA